MLSVRRFLAFSGLLSILSMLPTAARCDTSYYEKYYSARRFWPPKRAALVKYDFTVTLDSQEPLASFEQLALSGSIKQLGSWSVQKAILLNRTAEHRVWTGSFQLPVNASIDYRYFIAMVDRESRAIQVRRWETHIISRHFDITNANGNRTDNFGWISPDKYEVEHGWLASGSKMVQFKIFRNPFHINEGIVSGGEGVSVRIQPVDPIFLSPIVPSALAYSEYVRMVYGDSHLREQPEFGVPYQENDIIVFHTTLTDLEKVAFLIKVYATSSSSELVRLLGYQYIYSSALAGSEGNISVNLISPVWLNSVGKVELKYLVIRPLPDSDEKIDFRTSFVNYWRQHWTALDVGHRGLGRSLQLSTNVPPLVENTLGSLKASGYVGAEMVEFDVMLTKDLIPIISHDYVVHVCVDSKTPTSKDDLTDVLIKDLTYEQLKNLKTYQVVGSKLVEYEAYNNVENEDERLFPSFEDFLTKVNKSVGFDIEIKWPQLKASGQMESYQTIDKNTYIDRILQVTHSSGCGRLSFFTSFDADVCSLLRYKQNMYPVMFLSSSVQGNFHDPRSDTIYDSVNNAQAFHLAGIVPNGKFIQADPNWIEIAKRQNKKVFLWGDTLKDNSSITWFKEQGPTGVIYDRLDLYLPPGKQSLFDAEADLPEFFEQQCPTNNTDDDNSVTEPTINYVNFL